MKHEETNKSGSGDAARLSRVKAMAVAEASWRPLLVDGWLAMSDWQSALEEIKRMPPLSEAFGDQVRLIELYNGIFDLKRYTSKGKETPRPSPLIAAFPAALFSVESINKLAAGQKTDRDEMFFRIDVSVSLFFLAREFFDAGHTARAYALMEDAVRTQRSTLSLIASDPPMKKLWECAASKGTHG